MEKQKMNTTVIYILAILGFLCCCFGGLGFIPAAIAFFMANSKVKEWKANPDNYENGNAMNTAKIVAMISLIINVIYFGLTIYRIATVGWDEIMLQNEEMMRQYGM